MSVTSRFSGNGTIVPGRKVFVENDPHRLLVALGDFFTDGVLSLKDFDGRSQPFLGSCLGHLLHDQADGREDHALAGTGHMGEEAMLDRVIL